MKHFFIEMKRTRLVAQLEKVSMKPSNEFVAKKEIPITPDIIEVVYISRSHQQPRKLAADLKGKISAKERQRRAKIDQRALTSRAQNISGRPGPFYTVALESAALRSVVKLAIQQSEPSARVLCMENVVSAPLLSLLDALAIDMDRGALLRTGMRTEKHRSAIFNNTLRSVDDEDIALSEESRVALDTVILPFVIDVLTQLGQELPIDDPVRCQGIVPLLAHQPHEDGVVKLRSRIRQVFTLRYTKGAKMETHRDNEARLLTVFFPLTELDRAVPVFRFEHGALQHSSMGYSRGDVIVFRGVDIRHCSLPSPAERCIINLFFTSDEFISKT